MPRKPDDRITKAKELYLKGMKLVEIASQLNLPEGTVRRWKSTHNWDSERSDKKSERSKKKTSIKKQLIQEEVKAVLENDGLTDKQKLFCIYFVKSFNATKAYEKAYECDYRTALCAGPRLLGNDRVKAEINNLKQAKLSQAYLSQEDVFQKYMDIAFADITDYVTFGREEVPVMGPFGPITVKDDDTGEKIAITKIVNTVRFNESTNVDGTIVTEVKQGRDGASIKLADRQKALDWLANHMDIGTSEQKAKVELLNAQIDKIKRDADCDDDEKVVIVNDV